jgi:hypothetical protein
VLTAASVLLCNIRLFGLSFAGRKNFISTLIAAATAWPRTAPDREISLAPFIMGKREFKAGKRFIVLIHVCEVFPREFFPCTSKLTQCGSPKIVLPGTY